MRLMPIPLYPNRKQVSSYNIQTNTILNNSNSNNNENNSNYNSSKEKLKGTTTASINQSQLIDINSIVNSLIIILNTCDMKQNTNSSKQQKINNLIINHHYHHHHHLNQRNNNFITEKSIHFLLISARHQANQK